MKVNQADKSNPINNSIFNKDKFNIAFSVGEISGDINASALIKEINCRMPDKVYSWGIGGMRMREVGVDTILDTSKMGTIGVFETLKLIPSFIYQYNFFKKAILLHFFLRFIFLNILKKSFKIYSQSSCKIPVSTSTI